MAGGELLDLIVFFAVLAAALMHAGWNAVVRVGLDRFSSILLLSMTQSGLALLAHHLEGVVATELPDSKRHIYAATYGEPPDPPATAALLAALAQAATATAG